MPTPLKPGETPLEIAARIRDGRLGLGEGIDAIKEFGDRRGEEERAKALREARFAPLGDNHHNAAACPYCGDLLTKAREEERAKALEDAAEIADAAEADQSFDDLSGAAQCATIARRIRSLAAAPSGDAKGTK